MFKCNKLMAVLICLMGVRVTLAFGFQAYKQDSEGEMQPIGNPNLDEPESNSFLNLSFSLNWASEKYQISFDFNKFEIAHQSEEEKSEIFVIEDGADVTDLNLLGKMDLTCITLTFKGLDDKSRALFYPTEWNHVQDLSKKYTPKEEFKGDYQNNASDIYMMMSKANAWMAENCASQDDKIISVEKWGNRAQSIRFGYKITVMNGFQLNYMNQAIAKKVEEDSDFKVKAWDFYRGGRMLLLV